MNIILHKFVVHLRPNVLHIKIVAEYQDFPHHRHIFFDAKINTVTIYFHFIWYNFHLSHVYNTKSFFFVTGNFIFYYSIRLNDTLMQLTLFFKYISIF